MAEEKVEAPKRLWVQMYGSSVVSAYDSDPREVHDNGKPVYQYVLADTPNTRQRAERAARRIWNSIDHIDGPSDNEMADIIAAEFEK